MAVGIVGGATRVHPGARAALKLMGVTTAAELAHIIISVGLAQNLAALRALSTEGIQRGHMSLHARQVAIAAGAPPELVEKLAEELVKEKTVRVDRAWSVKLEARLNATKPDYLKTARPVGIIGYGAYVPQYRIACGDRARVGRRRETAHHRKADARAGRGFHHHRHRSRPQRSGAPPASELRAVWTGSESHLRGQLARSWWRNHRCRATIRRLTWNLPVSGHGSQLMAALVGNSMARYALAIGVDPAEVRATLGSLPRLAGRLSF